MTKLHDLYDQQRQSPWVDNLQRSWITGGHLAELVAKGIRGVTSNPTIFAKAIEAGSDYDQQFSSLIGSGPIGASTIENAYWELVVDDIRGALEVLRPIYYSSDGSDGFVSIEVAPSLAHDTDATLRAARSLHELIAKPNLMVKVPATAAGVPAIRALIAEGRNINVTLIFSLERYAEVMEAYLSGLEELVQHGGDPSQVNSVASFFVSRVDSEVDGRLDRLAAAAVGPGREKLEALRGKAGLSQARLAYASFRSQFSGPRFEALAAVGAKVQRPLWASTSTKNPAYPDLLYADGLIGPDTVDTLPEATIDAFMDHGTVRRTVDEDLDGSRSELTRLAEAGIDVASVTQQLEDEGVASFSKSFDELMQSLSDKAHSLAAR
ncbi:MAG: transaldolase [Acidimicrobiales bacterium]